MTLSLFSIGSSSFAHDAYPTRSTKQFANQGRIYLAESGYSIETPGKTYSINMWARAGKLQPVIRMELRPGDVRSNEGDARERVEFRSTKSTPDGVKRWYAGAFRIGDFVPDSAYTIIMQWINSASGNLPHPPGPWLRFALARGEGGVLEISHRGSDADGKLRPRKTTTVNVGVETWHTFVVETRTGLSDGLVRVWIDGIKVTDWAGGALGDFYRKGSERSNAGVMKFGVYRWWAQPNGIDPQTSTATVWFTNIEQSDTNLSRRINEPLSVPRGVPSL